ncbi:hypothetical protein KQI30_12355 [Clostridium bornimense]|uniref:hypothetical protein n=1 Tax=Clostridium bornimense TaxID=1216932 RepID=UPI001C107137|nr:hypothetical protein [Clostridium bornimense]MBU5317048.1 hypothetical protein [Clostridium bornimense]
MKNKLKFWALSLMITIAFGVVSFEINDLLMKKIRTNSTNNIISSLKNNKSITIDGENIDTILDTDTYFLASSLRDSQTFDLSLTNTNRIVVTASDAKANYSNNVIINLCTLLIYSLALIINLIIIIALDVKLQTSMIVKKVARIIRLRHTKERLHTGHVYGVA